MSKRLIIARGCPGSGKSYLARSIAGELGGKVYSSDALLMTRDGYHWTDILCFAAHQISEQLVRLAVDRKESVIVVDNTHLLPKYARPHFEYAIAHGYEVDVVEPNTPWRFSLEGLLAHGVHHVPREILQEMLNTWLRMPLDKFKEHLYGFSATSTQSSNLCGQSIERGKTQAS